MERGYADLFLTRKHMEINNLPRFRLSERLQSQNFVSKYKGQNSAPFKVVEQGYTNLFPTWKHIEINNLSLLRLPKKFI